MNNIKSKSFFNIITQLITLFVPLILAPYISRVFLPETFGDYTYSASIVTYFTLIAGLGLNNYGVQRVASLKNDKDKLSCFFSEMFFIRLTTTLASVSFMMIVVIVQPMYKYYYLILSMNIINVFFDITWFFQGLENFKLIALRSIFVKILLCVLTFVFVKNDSDIYLYVVIVAATTLLPNMLLWPSLRKHVRLTTKNLSFKKHFKMILGYFIPSIAVTIYTVLDKTMIQLLSSDSREVAFYEQAYKIMITSTSITNVLCPVFLPMMTGISDKIVVHNIYKKTFRLTYFISFILFAGLLATSNDFVVMYYGENYINSISILKLFSVMPVLVGIHNLIEYQYIYPNLYVRQSTIIICLGAVFNFVLNFPMIILLRSFGAAISTVATEVLIVVLYFVVLKKDYKIIDYLICSWKYLVSSIVSFFVMFLCLYFCDTSILYFALTVIAGVLSYIFVLLILKEYWSYLVFKKITFKSEYRMF